MYYDHAKAAYENKCKEEYEELKENLSDIYKDVSSGNIPNVHRRGKLAIG